jgi:hypothetical protein
MCDNCRAISWEIAASQRLLTTTTDPLALSWLGENIAQLRAEKAALHPELELPGESEDGSLL